MNPFIAIAGAVLIFLLFIAFMLVSIMGACAAFHHYRNLLVEQHRNRIRQRSERRKTFPDICRQVVIDLVPEEICAVSREEYEADMRMSAPISPLEGCDIEWLEREALRHPTGFLQPSLN